MKKQLLTWICTGLLATNTFGQALNESFETWPPAGWEIKENSGKSWTQSEQNCNGSNGPGKAYDGEYAALYQMLSGPFGYYELISPSVDLTTFKNPELSFAWFYKGMTTEQSYLEILASYDNAATSDEYESIATIPVNVTTPDWTVFKQVLNRGVKKVIFRVNKVTGASFRDLYMDQVIIGEGPAVAAPIRFDYQYVNGKDGSVLLSWKAINDENCWNLKISDKPINPTEENGCIEQNQLSQPEFLVENLTVGTHYYAYVQTSTDNQTSEWTSLDFQMDKSPIAAPFTIDFENDNGGFTYVQEEQTNQWCWGSAANREQGGKSLYISSNGSDFEYATNSNNRSYAYRLVQFPDDMKNGALLTFDFRGIGKRPNHSMEIYVIQDLSIYPVAGSYLQLKEGKISKLGDTYCEIPDWTRQTVEIPESFAGQTVRLVFSWRDNNYETPGASSAAIDNLKIETAEVNIPKNLTESEATTHSLTLNWDFTGNETSWEVEYGDYNFETGTGKVVTTTEQPPFTLTGLEDGRYYGIRVRALAGDAVSDDSELLIASTKPADKKAPYTCNFDECGMIPADWTYYTGLETTMPYILSEERPYYTHSTPNAVVMVSQTGKENLTLITPPFSDLKDRKSRITFYANIHPMQNLTVGVMSDPADISTFVPLKKYMGSDYGTVDNSGTVRPDTYRHILSLDSELITDKHKYVAFMIGETFQKPTSIDDFVYETVPDFQEPANLKVLDVFDTSARLTWTPQNNETKWEVAFGENDYDVDNTTAGTIVENEPMITLSDLPAGQYYTAFVRAIDTDGNKSQWAESYFFRTCDGNWEMPYMEAFDEMRSYGITPLGWGAKDYTSRWGLSKENYNSYPNCVERTAENSPTDDWLFTPPFEFDKDKTYLFSMRVKTADTESEAKITLHYGSSPEAASMSKAIVTEEQLTDQYKLVKMLFSVDETGIYRVGIHYQDPNSKGLWIDDAILQKHKDVSISNEMKDLTPSVYPAIAQDRVYVTGGTNPMAVSLFSLNGTMLWNDPEYISDKPIHVDGWAAGTYLIQIVTSGNTYQYKVIISR